VLHMLAYREAIPGVRIAEELALSDPGIWRHLTRRSLWQDFSVGFGQVDEGARFQRDPYRTA
jgi:hypothetical protein